MNAISSKQRELWHLIAVNVLLPATFVAVATTWRLFDGSYSEARMYLSIGVFILLFVGNIAHLIMIRQYWWIAAAMVVLNVIGYHGGNPGFFFGLNHLPLAFEALHSRVLAAIGYQ